MARFDYDPNYLLSNLNRIQSLLARNDKDIFLRNYPRWKKQRVETISINKTVQDKLNKYQHGTNVGRAVGTGVGVLGGLAAVVGFGLSLNPSTKEMGDRFVGYGMTAGAIGGTTAVVSGGVNSFTSWSELKTANTTFKKDKDLTEELFPFLQTQELEALFEEVFGCSILSDTVSAMFAIVDKVKVLCGEGLHTFEDISEIVCAVINRNLTEIARTKSIQLNEIAREIGNVKHKTKLLLREFCRNVEVRQSVLIIRDRCQNSPLAFELSKIYLRHHLKMSIMQKSSLALSLVQIINSSSQQAIVTTLGITFGFVKLAIDIIALISTIEDLKDKQPSKYAEMLKKVNVFLSAELRNMTALYDEIEKM